MISSLPLSLLLLSPLLSLFNNICTLLLSLFVITTRLSICPMCSDWRVPIVDHSFSALNLICVCPRHHLLTIQVWKLLLGYLDPAHTHHQRQAVLTQRRREYEEYRQGWMRQSVAEGSVVRALIRDVIKARVLARLGGGGVAISCIANNHLIINT